MSNFPQEPRPEKKSRTVPRLTVTSAGVTGLRALEHARLGLRGNSATPSKDKRAAGNASVHISEANMTAAIASAPPQTKAHDNDMALSRRVTLAPAPPKPFSERLGQGLRRTLTLGADAIVLTLASPFLLVYWVVQTVKRTVGSGRHSK